MTNTFKRLFAVILVISAVFSLSACGKRNSIPGGASVTVSAPSPTPIAVPTPVPTPVPTSVPTPVPITSPASSPAAASVPIQTPSGTPVPVVTPAYAPTSAPVVTPAPTPVPTPTPNPYLRITKDPTGEVVDEGGKAYFVARAENYSGITWLISNNDGSILYQDGAAASMFPGLQISGLGTETLCLQGIPYDMSGWKVQAQFSGLGGPLSTSYAYITVNRVSETYDSLLAKYREVVNGADASTYDFSYLCNLDRSLGYCMEDVDSNGVFELLIGSLYGDGMIIEAYTLSGGTPVKLFSSGERDRYYLSNSASFYRHGSSGAANSTDTLYSCNGSSLIAVECVWSDDTYSQTDPEFYHCYGDRYSGYGDRIDADSYNATVNNMAYSTRSPSFIPIQ